MSKQIVFLLACFLPYFASAQAITNLSQYNCLQTTVQYTVEGQATKGILLFVTYADSQYAMLQYSNVYLLGTDCPNQQLLADTAAFVSVYDIKTSANSKYLAISMASEGHPWIEIYDLQQLIDNRQKQLLATINGYPGNVSAIGWQGDCLIIDSDIDLLPQNKDKELLYNNLPETNQQYTFDPKTRKFAKHQP